MNGKSEKAKALISLYVAIVMIVAAVGSQMFVGGTAADERQILLVVTGHVYDDDGNPVDGLWVNVTDNDTGYFHICQTSSGGLYVTTFALSPTQEIYANDTLFITGNYTGDFAGWSGSNTTTVPYPLPPSDIIYFDLHVVKPPNYPPNEPTNPNPANGSVDVSIHTTLSCYVSDPEGDPMDVSFYWQGGTLIQSFSGVGNGTVTTSALSLDYSTTYYWYVMVEDNMFKDSNTSALWHFTTEANLPPDAPTNPVPADGAVNVSTSTTLKVDVSDPNGDDLDVSFYWANATLIETVTGVPSGGTAETSALSLALNTTYEWYAVASDGLLSNTSATWSFTTVAEIPGPVIVEDFEGAFPPTGWTVVGSLWDRNDAWGRPNYAGGNGYCADADSDAYGAGGDAELWTPSFSIPAVRTPFNLEFISSYNDIGSGDYADVDISTDGGSTWTNLLHWDEDHDAYGPGEEVSIDLTPYAGNDCIIRFHYYAPGWDWWWEVDDVVIGPPIAHDVGVEAITSPGATEMEGDVYINATICNYGVNTETFDVNCTVYQQTAAFMQPVHTPSDDWSAGTTDAGAGYKMYENFWDVSGDITTVTWYGLTLYYSGGWYAGDPDGMNFYLDFYSDDPNDHVNMPPSDSVASFDLSPSDYTATDTGNTYAGYSLYKFECTLPSSVSLTDGWIAIQSHDDADGDWFLWMSAQTGDGFSYQDGSGPTTYDRALTFNEGGSVIYTAEQTVTGLAAGTCTNISFLWTGATPGIYIINITTKLPTDMVPGNDYMESSVIITGITDVGVEEINSPTEGEVIQSIDPVIVNATIKNYGTVPALREDIQGTITDAHSGSSELAKDSWFGHEPQQVQRSSDVTLRIFKGGALFYEDFESGIPGTWTIDDGYSDGATWRDDNPSGRVPPSGSNCDGIFAIADEDYEWTPMDEYLISPVIDCTGQTGLKLAFGSYFHSYSWYDQYAEVDVYDGATWQNVYYFTGGDDYAQSDIDISAYADNNPDFQIRFHFFSNDWAYYWMVDNVMIYTGEMPGIVHEETITIPTLDVGEEYYAEFTPWYATDAGDYTAYVITQNPDDMVPGNDMKMVNFTIEYVAMDVSVDSIDNPEDGGVYQAGEQIVQATVCNNGDMSTTFDVNCSIYRILEGMRDVTDWLGYDGPNDNAIGLTSGGTFEGAIRLTPTELSGYDGYIISTVKFHHGMAGSTPHEHSGNIKIYAGDTPTSPGALITSEPWTSDVYDWVEVPLSSPVTIDETQDYWISVEVTHAAGEYPLGCDAGPAVDGKGDWIYLSPGPWEELQNYGLDYNWNIEAGVEPGGPPQELVYFDEETVTDLPAGECTTVDFLPAWDAEPGEYRIVVTALVQDDNPENNEQEISVIILADETPPVSDLTVTLDPDGYVKRASRFTITATDAEDSPWRIYYKIDGVLFEKDWNEDAVFQLNEIWGYAPGPHIIEYWAVDLAGNEEVHHLETYVLDVDGPEVDLAFSGIHEVTLDNIDQITPETLIEINAVDDRCGVDRIEYRLGEDGELMLYEGPFTLPDGYYDLFIVAHDRLDNVGEKHYMIQVGGGEPATFCDLSPAEPTGENGWYVTPVTVSLEATDDASGVSHTLYKIDNGNWNTYTGPFVIDSDGAHTVYYYSVDNAGNEEGVKTRQVNIDFYGPTITIQKPANYIYLFDRPILPWIGYRPVVIGSISVTATVVDTATSGIQNVELYVNNQLKGTYSGNVVYTLDEPSFGETVIKVVAKDMAGNTQTQTIRALIYNW